MNQEGDLYDQCFGKLVQEIRLAKKINPIELARVLNIEVVELIEYEQGTSAINQHMIHLFAEALGMEPGDLFEQLELEVMKKKAQKSH